MRIKKVEKLNYARFRNFSWDTHLDAFNDNLNILFGWNGSGKTTFSKVFRDMVKDTFSDGCSVRIKTKSDHFTERSTNDDIKQKIRVFNDDYVHSILTQSHTIPYIFFAGKDAADYSNDEVKLEAKKADLLKITLPSKHEEIAKNTAELIRTITGINSYKKELTGGSTYSSYDKADFQKRIKNIKERVKKGEIKSYIDLVRSDIENLKSQLINSNQLSLIDRGISVAAQWLIDSVDGINNILTSKPVQKLSNRISSLKEEQMAWVEKGVPIHFKPDHIIDRCIFCNSEILNSDELLKHFSNDVVNALNAIDEYLNKIHTFTQDIAKQKSLTKIQKSHIKLLRSVFDQLAHSLTEKRVTVSVKKQTISVDTAKINEATNILPSDSTAAAFAIESHYVATKYEEYEEACAAYDRITVNRDTLVKEIGQLDRKIRTLKQKAKNTHKPASDLTKLFNIVFPYRSIEITDNEEGTGYILKRDGDKCPFASLSEGEKNFIALAYFIYSNNDAQNKLSDDGVVIIDDPVSSLDKQAIFQIFSMIVNEIDKYPTRQYFILTHNLDFLGHLKEHFSKKIAKKEVGMYSFAITQNGCSIENLPKLLKDHRSDYYYVFSVLYKYKDHCELEDAHLIVNLLRRWLETFLEFKYTNSNNLRSTLKSACDEAKKLTSAWGTPFGADYLTIYRYVNHGSHGFSDTESTDESILTNSSTRIQEIFQMVKILDPLHYKKLESLV